MTDDHQSGHRPEDSLERYFDAARAQAPQLRAGVRARILADAARVPSVAQSRRVFALRAWMLPSVAGGAVAALAGFWIGLALPLDGPLVWLEDAVAPLQPIAALLPMIDDPLFMGY